MRQTNALATKVKELSDHCVPAMAKPCAAVANQGTTFNMESVNQMFVLAPMAKRQQARSAGQMGHQFVQKTATMATLIRAALACPTSALALLVLRQQALIALQWKRTNVSLAMMGALWSVGPVPRPRKLFASVPVELLQLERIVPPMVPTSALNATVATACLIVQRRHASAVLVVQRQAQIALQVLHTNVRRATLALHCQSQTLASLVAM